MMRESCSDVSVGEVDGVYRIYYSDGYRGGSTEPIRFCPMCGEPFPEVVQDSLESIKQDMTLGACEYAKKRSIGNGVNASDKQATCSIANGRTSTMNAAGLCATTLRTGSASCLTRRTGDE